MNTKLRIKANNEFEKYFFKLMINSVFGKTQENIRKQRYIKFVTIDEKRNRLVSEANYHTTKRFSENLLATEMKNAKAKMNKPVYLGMSILDISKTLMYKFWYDQIKTKYGDSTELRHTDTDSIIAPIMTEDFYRNIAGDVERWFDTSNYDENDERPLPIGKNKKVYGFFKDGLGGKILKEFVALRPKTYAYLIDVYDDDCNKDKIINKKARGTKTCVIKRELRFENYKDCLFNGEVVLKTQQIFKSDHHKVYTEEVNIISLSSNDDKRLQTFYGIETYPYETTNEILKVFEAKETQKM